MLSPAGIAPLDGPIHMHPAGALKLATDAAMGESVGCSSNHIIPAIPPFCLGLSCLAWFLRIASHFWKSFFASGFFTFLSSLLASLISPASEFLALEPFAL